MVRYKNLSLISFEQAESKQEKKPLSSFFSIVTHPSISKYFSHKIEKKPDFFHQVFHIIFFFIPLIRK
nr:MAG TPA: RXT2-like, N-terminal [Bacteriophage sp.]